MAVAGTSTEMVPQKKFKELPIFIAENHNEVLINLNFWYRLLLWKYLDKTLLCYWICPVVFFPPPSNTSGYHVVDVIQLNAKSTTLKICLLLKHFILVMNEWYIRNSNLVLHECKQCLSLYV
jgi:hypothetical protein